jgi:hypothetical protein
VANELRNEAGTPRLIFDTLHAEYRFTIDICASWHNHKLPRYITKEQNALAMHWGGERVYCNSPFSNIPLWLAHTHEPEFAVFMLPVRADRLWWMTLKPLVECHYFVGEKPYRRPQFEPPPGVTYSSNPFCLCLFVVGEGAIPGHEAYRCGITGSRIG